MKKNLVDLSGMRFGRWVVVSYAGASKNKAASAMWNCRCDCGVESVVYGATLRRGESKSCGCSTSPLNRGYRANQVANGQSKHKLYATWLKMRNRCRSPSSDSWKNYGGRGITICDQWSNPLEFIRWAENSGYEDGLTLDRVDVNGPYSPDNCRWITRAEQSRNKRTNVKITIGGEVRCLSEWASHYGVNESTARYRFRNGKPLREVFSIKDHA